MTWALKRQIFYVTVLFAFFSIFAIIISYPYLNKIPTCNDGKKNGTEAGVDCGGSCALACIFQVDEISVLWSRLFKVVPGRYNAVAYLENQNTNTAINKIKYRFRFADENNVYIGKREGETSIPPRGKFAIFESAIDMGNSIPVYTTFEFIEVPIWVKVPAEKVNQLKVSLSDVELTYGDYGPKLSAILNNESFFIIPDINIVAILYDKMGNAINASSTYLETLQSEESQSLSFTWPEKFEQDVVTKDIIPIYNIFDVKLK